VKKTIPAFAAARERRGLGTDAYPGIKIWYAEIQHPLQELEEFYAGRCTLDVRIALIVAPPRLATRSRGFSRRPTKSTRIGRHDCTARTDQHAARVALELIDAFLGHQTRGRTA
jgi:hypothetical protein